MEIEKISASSGVILKLKGRLDAQWADHLGQALEEVIRQGDHQISLDAAQIDYVSSAGVRVLLIYYKRLQNIGGRLAVVNPSKQALALLTMSGLRNLMTMSDPPVRTPTSQGGHIAEEVGRFEVVLLNDKLSLTVTAIGHPDVLLEGIAAGQCRPHAFPSQRFGLGVGSLGGDVSRERLGEFLSVGGMTAGLPAGATTPDYLVSAADFVPEVCMAYGLVADGGFSHLIRFTADAAAGNVSLQEIVAACLDTIGATAVGVVIVGENAGLVGASLRQVPIESAGKDFFTHPAVRTRLTFTSERAYTHHVSVVTGFACRAPHSLLDPFLRPVGNETTAQGHFHAAAFSYQPLSKGLSDPVSAAARLFKEERLLGLLHLLADERPITGVGQSEWVRGVCWVSALADVQGEGHS